MKSNRSRWISRILRLALCVGAIGFLVYSVPWHDRVHLNDKDKTAVRLIEQRGDEFVVLRDGVEVTLPASEIHFADLNGERVPDIEYGIPRVINQTNHVWALWAVLIFIPVPLMSAVRLVWMLAIQQVRLSFWEATKLTFAGNFFNFALPGTTGGDVIKAYYITRFTHRKTEAVTTVFLDRAVGLLSLVIMAGVAIILTRDPSQFSQFGLPLTLSVICGVLAVGGIIVFSRRVRRFLHLRYLVSLLPMSDQLQRIGHATLAMRQHKGLMTISLLITFALQSITMTGGAIMAWALGMQGTFDYFFIYIAIGFLIAAVPTTPQGLGVVEAAYVLFFTHNGQNAASQALALALAIRLIQLIWSLPGVLVPLLGAHMPSRDELRAIETAGESNADAAVGGATDRDEASGYESATPSS
ncbi:MAG: lysylphosphatidylglycerol synthase transmembrane domain-containing protein [Phycisphaerae bacterium]|jgi:uncharacterized protein (TIRG00374 family)